MSLPYYLGGPIWSWPAWKGQVYQEKAPQKDFLKQYSQAFPAIEGNTTFYQLPSVEKARGWVREVADGFQFALKIPKVISHEKRLRGAEAETQAFIDALRVLQEANHLGPSLLNMRPTFAGQDFDTLVQFLRAWPTDLPLAVEPRHMDYFDNGATENSFNQLLSELYMDRAVYDTRPLHAAPATTEAEQKTQQESPNLPPRIVATGRRPFLRLLGRDDLTRITSMIDEWSAVVANWIDAGLTPYVFVHTPDYGFVPDFAKLFHEAVRKRCPKVPPLAASPAEVERRERQSQRSLF